MVIKNIATVNSKDKADTETVHKNHRIRILVKADMMVVYGDMICFLQTGARYNLDLLRPFSCGINNKNMIYSFACLF